MSAYQKIKYTKTAKKYWRKKNRNVNKTNSKNNKNNSKNKSSKNTNNSGNGKKRCPTCGKFM
jgi:hypothetical protein